MPFCPNCGTGNPDGARFCQSCGTAIPPIAPVRRIPAMKAKRSQCSGLLRP